MLLPLIIMAAVLVADQISKLLVLQYLVPVGQVKLIEGVLHLTYVENRGAAFGMLSNSRWVFMVLSCVAIVILIGYLWRYKPASRLLRLSLALIAGGGIGNMIDRTVYGFVVDFIDVAFVWDYVFNVADSAVCIGCGLMVLWFILSEVKEQKENKTNAGSEEIE